MKSRILLIYSVLFVLSLSVSLFYALWSNLPGVITYGVVAFFASFAFLYYKTRESTLLDEESCLKILYRAIIVFALLAFLIYAGVMKYIFFVNDEPCEFLSPKGLECIQILCLSFFCIAMEAATIMVIKDTRDCQELQ